MPVEFRCRSLPETLDLAITAAGRAGVTRVSDVTAFAVPGIPVFQATRPETRSLSVSQGKGLTSAAAIVGALLEAVEFCIAERLSAPAVRRPLDDLDARQVAIWSGDRDNLAIDLDRTLPRPWLAGTDLHSGGACEMPWDMLSLDFTRPKLEYPATSCGLACGNNRTEALVSGVAELLAHHCLALFERSTPRQRLAWQIALATIEDPTIARVMQRIERAGFELRAWSMGQEHGLAAIRVAMFGSGCSADDIAPVAGLGCHPDARVALLRALLEAVQTRAGLVAGARDDLTVDHYVGASKRTATVILGTLAFGDGLLNWDDVPHVRCASSEQCLDALLAGVQRLTNVPVVAFDHDPPGPGLHLVHVLCPGLLDLSRKNRAVRPVAAPRALISRRQARPGRKKILFAGPSIAGLTVPEGIDLRPPALCGDLAALLDDPPAAVGLIDGYFKLAPSVWHKEILCLLALGVRVIGGASLGAMRAAELERFGMVGTGAIFHGYRSGLLVRDDAVMLVHAPEELGYAPLSVPLVDAEYALLGKSLPPRARRTMQRILRTTPFETRTWRSCLAAYRARTGKEFPMTSEQLDAAPSLKRSDAALVIEALASFSTAQPAPALQIPPLTSHHRQLLATAAPAFAAGPV